jgi:hypothetical protein
MHLRTLALVVCCTLLPSAGFAQMETGGGRMNDHMPPETKPIPSPAATAEVSLNGKNVTIQYGAPSLRGRKMIGEHDPYGKVWRTGANSATTLITAANLQIGSLQVPAGTYTLYTLPNPDQWLLIINKQTGQWGTVYNESKDLGRTPMTSGTLPSAQEKMSISFEKTKGNTTELHIKWDKADEYVTVKAD